MALNAEFLTGVFSNEETSMDDKIKLILSESEADNRGLIQKRDELLGKEKKYKEQIAGFETERTGYDEKIAGLEEELKKNSPEQHKQFYEAQLAEKQKKFDDELAKIQGERDFFKTSHLKRLRDDAISEGVKDIQFVDGLRNGFIATVLMQNQFEAKEIDGQLMFLNGDNKTIQDVIHDFSLSNEGKAYIKNPTSGGNAHTSSMAGSSSSTKNTITRAEYDELMKDPAKFAEFRATHKSWSISD